MTGMRSDETSGCGKQIEGEPCLEWLHPAAQVGAENSDKDSTRGAVRLNPETEFFQKACSMCLLWKYHIPEKT